MAYIKALEFHEMEEPIKKQLEAAQQKMGQVGEIARILALRPDIYNVTTSLFRTLMINRTELDYNIKESIAILVSKANSCEMCVGEHQRIAKMLGMTEEQVNRVLSGIEHMDVSDREKILYEFCLKCASKENYKIIQRDIDSLREAGYSDSQILEAVAIVAYFNYINTISNSLGAGK